MRRATNVARKNLVSLGTCIGKFTKSGKFHLQITALDLIAPYAKVGIITHLMCVPGESQTDLLYSVTQEPSSAVQYKLRKPGERGMLQTAVAYGTYPKCGRIVGSEVFQLTSGWLNYCYTHQTLF